MKPWLKKILLVVGVLLLLTQFIPVDRSTPDTPASADFLQAVNAPPLMAEIIRSTCYDCHSYESEYPWYAKVAPLSFWIQGHVNAGREQLNFSNWTAYATKKAAHKMEECAEEVRERHMPFKSYTWLHSDAKLSEERLEALAMWFEGIGNTLE